MHWEVWPAMVSGPADGEQAVGVKFTGRTQGSPGLPVLPLRTHFTAQSEDS